MFWSYQYYKEINAQQISTSNSRLYQNKYMTDHLLFLSNFSYHLIHTSNFIFWLGCYFHSRKERKAAELCTACLPDERHWAAQTCRLWGEGCPFLLKKPQPLNWILPNTTPFPLALSTEECSWLCFCSPGSTRAQGTRSGPPCLLAQWPPVLGSGAVHGPPPASPSCCCRPQPWRLLAAGRNPCKGSSAPPVRKPAELLQWWCKCS